jgi:hypothetical protein
MAVGEKGQMGRRPLRRKMPTGYEEDPGAPVLHDRKVVGHKGREGRVEERHFG